MPRESLYTADELFFTGTASEVTPIRSVDRIPIGEGRMGPVTAPVQQRYLDIARGRAPDTHGWLTPRPQTATPPSADPPEPAAVITGVEAPTDEKNRSGHPRPLRFFLCGHAVCVRHSYPATASAPGRRPRGGDALRGLAVRQDALHRLPGRVARDGVKGAFAERVEPRLEPVDLAGELRAFANVVQVHLLHPLVDPLNGGPDLRDGGGRLPAQALEPDGGGHDLLIQVRDPLSQVGEAAHRCSRQRGS